MAEKAMTSHSACVTLTYSDATQIGRDGARMFCYADVAAFLKRLRSAARYEAKKHKWNLVPQVRFLCAGEQGDRNGRCHWHLILFTNFDLASLGQYTLRGNQITDRRDMLTIGKQKRRLNWSLWPHGFMTLQEPDQGAMNYVLSYCLKDQFTQEKSQGTMREAKSENFATGLFRMSKRPAIGETFLIQKMERLDASGSVLPNLHLQVPDLSTHWEPTGSFRKKLLWHLVALNKRALWATGANAPQWSSLLSACADNLSDMEVLLGIPQEPQNDPKSDDYRSIETEFALRGRETAARQSTASFARSCAQSLPCRNCLDGFDQETLKALNLYRDNHATRGHIYAYQDGSEAQSVPTGRVHPYCQRKGSKTARLAAPLTGR
ncbi:hypothetical protein J2X53_003468 [Pseudorhodobacter sp. 4114]|nr:hypothetical protein [Pseudorhodobacter sp. 4114]